MSLPSTSFAALHAAGACKERYRHLAKALGSVARYGRNTPITLLQIFDANGLDDALWALGSMRDTPEVQRLARLFACDCAERVRHMMADERSTHALDVARRHALGEASDEELAEAWAAARDAARGAARDAARGAAWAAARDAARGAAWAAARDAARGAAWAAARDAARGAAWAAAWDAARGAAWDADWDAAWAAEREWQEKRFRELLSEGMAP